MSRTRFGSSVTIMSIQDGAQPRLSFEKSPSSVLPSALVSPSRYHSWVCPFITSEKRGKQFFAYLFMHSFKISKIVIKSPRTCFVLRVVMKYSNNIFLSLKLNSETKHLANHALSDGEYIYRKYHLHPFSSHQGDYMGSTNNQQHAI